jgi:hypothetical protein
MTLRVALFAAFLCWSAASAAAPSATHGARPAARRTVSPGGTLDPVAFVRNLYAPHAARGGERAAADSGPNSSSPDLTPRLRAAFLDDERYARGEVGRLEFNPYTGAQDEQISQVRVAARAVEGAPGRRVVTAHFRNINTDQTIVYFFERIGDRWYIDDILYASAQGTWTLSLILRYGYMGE